MSCQIDCWMSFHIHDHGDPRNCQAGHALSESCPQSQYCSTVTTTPGTSFQIPTSDISTSITITVGFNSSRKQACPNSTPGDLSPWLESSLCPAYRSTISPHHPLQHACRTSHALSPNLHQIKQSIIHSTIPPSLHISIRCMRQGLIKHPPAPKGIYEVHRSAK